MLDKAKQELELDSLKKIIEANEIGAQFGIKFNGFKGSDGGLKIQMITPGGGSGKVPNEDLKSPGATSEKAEYITLEEF